jgi:hypothetical protein
MWRLFWGKKGVQLKVIEGMIWKIDLGQQPGAFGGLG